MDKNNQSPEFLQSRCAELEKQVQYYKALAEEAGRNRLREIEQLHRQIAERKKAEQEVLAAEKKIRSWLELSPVCTKILDDDFHLHYMSSAGVKALKIQDITKFYGQKFPLDCYPEPTRSAIVQNLEKIKKTGERVTLDSAVFDAAGDTLWFQTTFVPVTDQVDQCDYIIAVSINITDQKRVEETQANLEKQLRQAQTIESMGLMAGGVAHDLNNILSGIIGYPDLILMDLPENSDLREMVLAIKDSGQRAASVVADLLTIARGVASSRESHNLHTIITAYLHSPEHKKLLESHPNITWQIRLEATAPYISCSTVHINKSLVNLVTNAAEAVADSGAILISTANIYLDGQKALKLNLQAGNYIVLEVSDTGKGLSKTEIGRIFEPFYTKKILGRSGTGLGLTVVWNTVQEHGGRIRVESDGAGTSFQLFFPLAKKQQKAPTQQHARQEVTRQLGHILVVDDDPRLRDIATRMLVYLGYSVDAVSSGEQAVEFIKAQAVDLVLLDMLMEPGMNGYQTYRTIVSHQPGQKAIITSGFSESNDVKAAIRLGVHAFLKKPYSIDQLGRMISEALGGDSSS